MRRLIMCVRLTGAPFEQHNGRSGAYLTVDQMVFREYRYSRMPGGHYQGTFRGRDKDVVSCMFAYVRTNSRFTQYQQDVDAVASGAVGIRTFESIAEIDYGLQVKPWPRIRPNLQYVINPGGTDSECISYWPVYAGDVLTGLPFCRLQGSSKASAQGSDDIGPNARIRGTRPSRHAVACCWATCSTLTEIASSPQSTVTLCDEYSTNLQFARRTFLVLRKAFSGVYLFGIH